MRAENQPPEISENHATGEIAEIFADIRRSFEAPIVNQIYRRMAGIPGCLDWAWSCVGPVVGSGDLEREARVLLKQLPIREPGKITPQQLRAVGIDEIGVRAINGVFDAYNRTNPMNLIAVQMLCVLLENGRGAPSRGEHRPGKPAPAQQTLPTLVDLESMDFKSREALLDLARLASEGPTDVVPTLFRHFGEWPGFLVVARDAIAPLGQDGGIGQTAKELTKLANIFASNIAAATEYDGAGVPAPSNREAEQLGNLLTGFTMAISRMIVIGHWLRTSMPR